MQHVTQLNNFIEDLLCLFYSPSASLQTQRDYSYTDVKLACHILSMSLLKWQDQYHLLEKFTQRELSTSWQFLSA